MAYIISDAQLRPYVLVWLIHHITKTIMKYRINQKRGKRLIYVVCIFLSDIFMFGRKMSQLTLFLKRQLHVSKRSKITGQ